MSVEIKQLVIKSNIANKTAKDSVSEKYEEANQQPSAPISEINHEELLVEVSKICKSLIDKEFRKRKER